MLSPLVQSHLNGNQNKNAKRAGKTRAPRVSKQEVAAVRSMLMQELLASGGQQQLRRAPKRGVKRPRTSGQNSPNDTGNATRYQNRNVRRGNMVSNFGMRGELKRLPSFTEQVGQPLSSAAWALFRSFSLNPGQANVFPVASVESLQWQKYRFRRFRVVYEPLVNEFNTNNDGAGEITIGFDPDASDQPPTSFSQAVNSKPVARGRPCDRIVLEIPRPLLQSQLDAHFVRHGNLPGGSDIKTYDVGLINVSVVGTGTTGATILGNLYFEYELDLMTQQIQLNTASPANNQVAQFSQSSVNGGATTVPSVVALATVDTNGLAAVNTAGSFILPPGNYLLDVTDNVVFSQTNQFDTTVLQIDVGGVKLNNLTDTVNWPAVVTEAGQLSHQLSGFFASTGSNALTIVTTDTFAAGTAAHTTTLRIVAV